MTQEEKTELKELLIFLDMEYTNTHDYLNDTGTEVLIRLCMDRPDFKDGSYRRKLATKLFALIDKEE